MCTVLRIIYHLWLAVLSNTGTHSTHLFVGYVKCTCTAVALKDAPNALLVTLAAY